MLLKIQQQDFEIRHLHTEECKSLPPTWLFLGKKRKIDTIFVQKKYFHKHIPYSGANPKDKTRPIEKRKSSDLK